MRVGLLGPLEVTADDGTTIELPGRKTRIMVAVLACQANRPVSADVLAEALWAETPPLRADASLRVYVHHLRKALGNDRIRRRAGGYVLSLEPGELDIDRFRALVADARRAEPAVAAESFGSALRLWRGPALFGLDSAPILADVAAALQELRLQAMEQRFDIELTLGHHDGIVADLRDLVARYPLRETFAAQLMRALIGGHRAAEAAAIFEATRRVLADELGLEPNPQLRRLHLSILRDETGPATPDTSVPRQLPAAIPNLAGRTASLAHLDTLLPTGAVAVISGAGGIGKTTLALHWAHHIQTHFPYGQLYVNLRGFDPDVTPTSPAEVLPEFLNALGVPAERLPNALDAQVRLYRTVLAERRVLIVLDNARDADQVRPLLPGSGNCLTVVTSRNQLTGLVVAEGAHLLTLDLLSPVEARELLAYRLGAHRVGAEMPATDELIECCAGLPLTLSIVAGRLAANPNLSLTAVAEELSHSRERLDLFAGDDTATDLRAVFSWSYQILNEPAARLFRLAGMHPGDEFGASAAAHLIDLPPAQTRSLLAQLVRMHLLTERSPSRYAFHDLLRAYATELALKIDSEPDRQAALLRLLDHYLHTAHAAAVALLHPLTDLVVASDSAAPDRAEAFAGHAAALSWLVTERPSLAAVVGRARDAGYLAYCWQLAGVLQEFLAVQGYWHDLQQIQQVALEAAVREENPAVQAAAHRGIARAKTLLGHYGQAQDHLESALELHRESSQPVHEGFCRHSLSIVYSSQGRHREALDNERLALEIFRRAGNARGEATALNTLGNELNSIGEHQEALGYAEQALSLNRRAQERHREPYILDTIADAHHHLGHYRLAQDYYCQAADGYRQVGHRPEEASVLANLGDAHHAAGEPELARDAWQQALTIAETLSHLIPGPVAPHGRLPDAEPLRAKLRQLG